MLVELGVIEQRSKAVFEVLDGASVTEVARRYGVCRQTVHDWLRRYANHGFAGLVDRSSKPSSCPHQMPIFVEARIVTLRREHPAWGPDRIAYALGAEGLVVPGRSSIYRALVRHRLVEATPRKRRRGDDKRWERSAPMELWQMDIVGGFHLAGGTECKVVTGIDDHSRYCICARLVVRATATPVCGALSWAIRTHGAPEQLLTDNAKVFTHRFGPGPGPVHFDRLCHEHGIRPILTAPYSPTTTGKVERFHKTLRAEFLTEHDRMHPSIDELQAALDAWVVTYNTERPHQSLGNRPPAERFALRAAVVNEPAPAATEHTGPANSPLERPSGVSRWCDQQGQISLGGFRYRVGTSFAGEPVEVVVRSGLVEILHAGVLVATHAERRRPGTTTSRSGGPRQLSVRRPNAGLRLIRSVDSGGSISFAVLRPRFVGQID